VYTGLQDTPVDSIPTSTIAWLESPSLRRSMSNGRSSQGPIFPL
jgi:hypothetical protein